MTVTWSYGGTALSSYGTITVMDDYMDIPDRRGDNILLPFRHGSVFVQKYYGERKITLGLAILSTSATAQDTLFDTLRASLSQRTQQTLSCTREDNTIRNALATVDVPMEVERITQTFARAVLQFTLTDPLFYSSDSATDNTTTISTTDTAMVVGNVGTVDMRDPTILLSGPLANVTISTTDGISMTYTGSISSSDTVTIGTLNGEYYAMHSALGSVIGNISHSGSSALLVLGPGTNNLSVKTTTTGGTVKISFYPPFL
jgi:phage-related protein